MIEVREEGERQRGRRRQYASDAMFTFDFCAAAAGLAYSAAKRGGNECGEWERGRVVERERGESIGKPVVWLLLLLVAPQAHTLLILILFHFLLLFLCFVLFFEVHEGSSIFSFFRVRFAAVWVL